MKSVKGKALRGKLIILTVLFFLLHPSFFTLHPVYAADSTPSADIRAKLDELKKEIASKAAKLKTIVDRKLKDKAYIGNIKQKSDNSITLATSSNPKIVSITQDTAFESNIKKKSKFSDKNLAEDDFIAALGDTDEIGVLTARKIILLPEPPAKQKTSLWGQVISASDQLITLKKSDAKIISVSIPSVSGIKSNSFVILTGNENKNGIFKAGFVYVIPEGGVIKPKKQATSSARLDTSIEPQRAQTASPSASPKTNSAGATFKPSLR